MRGGGAGGGRGGGRRRRLQAHRHLGQGGRRRPSPGVEQPLAEDGLDVDVDHHDVLDELGRPGHDPALGVEDERGAVEHQLVLAADQVHVDQRAGGVEGPGGEHPLPLRQPGCVVGRGVEVDDQLGPARRLVGDGPVGRPRVLADHDADPDAPDDEELARVVAGGEVALLVEDPVVGQQPLAVDAVDLALGAHRGRVVEVTAGVDEADYRRAPTGAGRHPVEGGPVVGYEAGLEQQILGWIPGDGQFGEHGQVALGDLGPVDGVEDGGGVALQVTDDEVELAGGDPDARHLRRLPRARAGASGARCAAGATWRRPEGRGARCRPWPGPRPGPPTPRPRPPPPPRASRGGWWAGPRSSLPW